jgi:small subunit ribosomal protein S16
MFTRVPGVHGQTKEKKRMEVRIRLQRAGKVAKGARNYRIVAIPRTQKRDGGNIEILGHYNPAKKPAEVNIDLQKVDQWVSKGAVLSDTVRSLVRQLKRTK